MCCYIASVSLPDKISNSPHHSSSRAPPSRRLLYYPWDRDLHSPSIAHIPILTTPTSSRPRTPLPQESWTTAYQRPEARAERTSKPYPPPHRKRYAIQPVSPGDLYYPHPSTYPLRRCPLPADAIPSRPILLQPRLRPDSPRPSGSRRQTETDNDNSSTHSTANRCPSSQTKETRETPLKSWWNFIKENLHRLLPSVPPKN